MYNLRQLGRYRIEGELGRGSMGVVYKALDTIIERLVALKVVQRPGPHSLPDQHEAYARFLREARASGNLSHPAIVTVFDVGEDVEQGVSYIAMEFVQGEPLDRLLRRRERLTPERISDIGAQVASALAAAHAAGVVHRDIKPANLILTREGMIKVTDFGIAKIQSASMTQDGLMLGTPQYMSPEQVRAGALDHRSDLWSLGIVLYELATLKPAFGGPNIFEIVRSVVTAEPVAPRTIRPDLPEELERTIAKAMAKDPDARFGSAEEMRLALEMTRAAPVPELPRRAVPVAVVSQDASELKAARQPLPGPARGGQSQPRAGVWIALWVGLLVLAGAGLWAALRHGPAEEASALAALEPPAAREELPVEPAPASVDPGEPDAGGATDGSLADPADADAALDGGGAAGTPLDFEVGDGAAGAEPETAAADGQQTTSGPLAAAPPDAAPVAAGTTPAADRTPAPPPAKSTGLRLPHSVRVRHRHRVGGCEGTLRIYDKHIEYDSSDHDKDDAVWSYQDLKDYTYTSSQELKFTEDKRDIKALGIQHREFRFELSQPLPADVLALLARKLAHN